MIECCATYAADTEHDRVVAFHSGKCNRESKRFATIKKSTLFTSSHREFRMRPWRCRSYRFGDLSPGAAPDIGPPLCSQAASVPVADGNRVGGCGSNR